MMSFSPFTINANQLPVYTVIVDKYEVVLDGP